MRESAESTLEPGVLSYCLNLEGGFDDEKTHSHGSHDRSLVLTGDSVVRAVRGWAIYSARFRRANADSKPRENEERESKTPFQEAPQACQQRNRAENANQERAGKSYVRAVRQVK